MTAIQKGHGVGELVLGAILSLCAFLIIILSGVMAGKADVGAILGPWWVGILVSFLIRKFLFICTCYGFFLQSFQTTRFVE